MTNSSLLYYLLLFAVAANLALGVLVILRNRTNSLNRSFLALTLAVGGWIATNAIFWITSDEVLKFQIALASYGFASMLAICFYVFSVVLVQHIFAEKRSVVYALTVFGVAMGLVSLVPGVVAHAVKGNQILTNSTLLGLYGLSILFLLARCVFVWVKARRHSRGDDTDRLNVILFSFTLAAIVGLVCNLLLPLQGNYGYVAIGPAGSLFFVVGTAYTIIKSRLFDIRSFVLLASAYLTTLFAVTLVFIAPFILALNYFLKTNLNTEETVIVIILSVCLLYLLQYLHRFFDKITSRLFFRHYYDLQDVLDKLGDILVRTADLKVLRDSTAAVLQEALKPEWVRYILLADDSDKDIKLVKKIDAYCAERRVTMLIADEMEMRSDGLAAALREQGIAIAAKLHTTHEDMGYMIVGHKRSGEIYTERDRRLLSVAADEIAISLQNVLRFEQIQRFNVTLQEEVDSKTRELQRKNKRLEDLDNIKDDFISMASHQLRTPLTSVKGYLSMVLEGDAGTLNATQEQMLKQAFTSSQRMVFLITDLLNVSRLKTGKFIIDATPTNLGDVVEQELDQLRETAQAKNITISYDRPTNFPELMIDEVKIRQVIMNFVDNAIYYTREGGRINVELNDLRSTVELRVNDNGIGVPKSEQHHLFTKFYRATNARKARPDGTGLGLFMAQKVVVAQGGAIIFTSKEGVGSTFGFTLPKAKLAVHEQGKPEDGEKTVAVSPAPKPRREVTTK